MTETNSTSALQLPVLGEALQVRESQSDGVIADESHYHSCESLVVSKAPGQELNKMFAHP